MASQPIEAIVTEKTKLSERNKKNIKKQWSNTSYTA